MKSIDNVIIFSHDILYGAICAHPFASQFLSGNKSVAGLSGDNRGIV